MRTLFKAVGGLLALTGTTFLLAWLTHYAPAPVEYPAIIQEGTPKTLKPGDTFSVVSWNLQYSASRKYHFFYDGGPAVKPSAEDVQQTVRDIQQALREMDGDVVLLQEVDRKSQRTQNVDQLLPFVEAVKPSHYVSTPYHKAVYLPVPPSDPLGPVETHKAILSRFELRNAERIQLAMLDEPAYRQWFNIKRCILGAEIPIEGGGVLRVGNTHLSAFSGGDGTLTKQVASVKAWLEKAGPWLFAGDFNMLPPGDDPARLNAEADLYRDAVNPISALVPQFSSVIPPEQMLEPRWRTYLPFGYAEPDRMIDYMFHDAHLEVLSVEVPRAYAHISDHLPMKTTFRLKIPSTP
ncbi:MAG: endonuclease/exonuclease/phosphatase family protein [Myxococcota bacterium]